MKYVFQNLSPPKKHYTSILKKNSQFHRGNAHTKKKNEAAIFLFLNNKFFRVVAKI